MAILPILLLMRFHEYSRELLARMIMKVVIADVRKEWKEFCIG